jgi:chromosome segregation ATPase
MAVSQLPSTAASSELLTAQMFDGTLTGGIHNSNQLLSSIGGSLQTILSVLQGTANGTAPLKLAVTLDDTTQKTIEDGVAAKVQAPITETQAALRAVQQQQGEDRTAFTAIREAIALIERQIAVLTARLDACERPVPETPIERLVTEAQAIELREMQQQLSQRVASLEDNIQQAFAAQPSEPHPTTTSAPPATSESESSQAAASRSTNPRQRHP